MQQHDHEKPTRQPEAEPASHRLYRKFARLCARVGGLSFALYVVATAWSVLTPDTPLNFGPFSEGNTVWLLCLSILAMVPPLHFRFLCSAGIIDALKKH